MVNVVFCNVLDPLDRQSTAHIIQAKPHKSHAGSSEDVAHDADLLLSLRIISLVDAQLVNPKHPGAGER